MLHLADLTRTLVAALAAFDTGAIVVVLALYVRAYLRAPSGSGILPRHVCEVALGSLGLVVGIGLATHDTIGAPDLTWRIPGLYLPALLLLAAGIVDVGTLQRRRIAADNESQRHGGAPSGVGRHRGQN